MRNISDKKKCGELMSEIEWTHLFPDLSEGQIDQINAYCQLLKEWNQGVNLVSRSDVDKLIEHHILPSLEPLAQVEIPPGAWVLDIGSGGGLPAIPLKIARPDLQMLMVDSIRKKVLFLKKVIVELGLQNCSAMAERVEILANDPGFLNRFDRITARAVTTIENLLAYGAPFLAPEGRYLLWKGESDLEELEMLQKKQGLKAQVYYARPAAIARSGKLGGLCWLDLAPGK